MLEMSIQKLLSLWPGPLPTAGTPGYFPQLMSLLSWGSADLLTKGQALGGLPGKSTIQMQ